MSTFRLEPMRCAWCGKLLDRATEGPGLPELGAPRADDVTVCAGCGGVLVFSGDPLGLRRPTDAELAELAATMPELGTAVSIVERIHGREPKQ
jgi:hypothetical protein